MTNFVGETQVVECSSLKVYFRSLKSLMIGKKRLYLINPIMNAENVNHYYLYFIFISIVFSKLRNFDLILKFLSGPHELVNLNLEILFTSINITLNCLEDSTKAAEESDLIINVFERTFPVFLKLIKFNTWLFSELKRVFPLVSKSPQILSYSCWSSSFSIEYFIPLVANVTHSAMSKSASVYKGSSTNFSNSLSAWILSKISDFCLGTLFS